MKLLVFSDSHGRAERVSRLLALHGDAEAAIFLGDGLRDLPAPGSSPCPLVSVRGNCDVFTCFSGAQPPDKSLLCFAGHTILALHGHTRGVKGGYLRAAAAARERGADILLFGHTHTPLEQYLPAIDAPFAHGDGGALYLFNPGALAEGSYGLIELRPEGVLFSHGELR